MVSFTMAWFSGSNHGTTLSRFWLEKSSPPETLQILSFETAKAMSRLVALYMFLSDDGFSRLRSGAIKSQGVQYLNSVDEGFLLSLACAEKLEELNSVALVVSRLGKKCQDSSLKHFDVVFANLKLGLVEVEKPEFNSRCTEKLIEKLEKYVSSTAQLYLGLESLDEMEASERKMRLWKLNVDPKLPQKTNHAFVEEKLAFQRKHVKHLRESCLWSKNIDNIVGLMARITCVIYARICELFSPFVPTLPKTSGDHHVRHHHLLHHMSSPKLHVHHVKAHPDDKQHPYIELRGYRSGPIPKSSRKSTPIRFYSQELSKNRISDHEITTETEKRQRVVDLAPPSSVGCAGLALRYANVIILAERYLNAPTGINDDARGYMYEMLPSSLRDKVAAKLRSRWRRDEVDEDSDGDALAEGWREALEEMMTWLGPVAHDTMMWQTERNLEKQRFDAKPTVMLFQTLHFADLEKTEATIAEVLVGLSCIYRYENRQLRRRDGGGGGGSS